jgi:hypothetical protein
MITAIIILTNKTIANAVKFAIKLINIVMGLDISIFNDGKIKPNSGAIIKKLNISEITNIIPVIILSYLLIPLLVLIVFVI